MSEWKLGYDIGGTKCAAILGKVSDNKISVVEKSSGGWKCLSTEKQRISQTWRQSSV